MCEVKANATGETSPALSKTKVPASDKANLALSRAKGPASNEASLAYGAKTPAHLKAKKQKFAKGVNRKDIIKLSGLQFKAVWALFLPTTQT